MLDVESMLLLTVAATDAALRHAVPSHQSLYRVPMLSMQVRIAPRKISFGQGLADL